MKTKSLLNLLALFGALATASTAFGQASFLFDLDNTNGNINLADVGASGEVEFFLDNGTWKSGVDILNDSTTNAMITGFYVLKPWTDDGEIEAVSLDEGLANWSIDDDNFGSLLNEYFTPGSKYTYLYFGAETQNPGTDGLAEGNSAYFEFSMASLDAVDWDDYLAAEVPHIFVRWQAVNNGDSAKGFDTFTVVPEPRLIGGLAIVGLGGVLWIRRRLTSKK